MLQREMTLLGRGFDAHTAALFSQIANRYASQIFIRQGNKMINGKSIMGVLSLGAIGSESVTLMIKGEDEEEAMRMLTESMSGNFNIRSFE